ncbi:MAG: DUF167 domain-containing protein [Acidobacteria bacterium]|nr:DUF167 domain-containing protein [Acidobacteriota bacterium]
MTLKVKVIPGSSRTEMTGVMADGTIKIRVAAPPEKGKANAELCAFLARHYGVPRRNVEILTGETSARKQVLIRGLETR